MTAPKKNSGSLHWHLLGGNNKHSIGANAGLCTYDYVDENGISQRKAILFDIGTMGGEHRTPEDPALAESDTIMPDMARFFYKTTDAEHRPETPADCLFLTHNHHDHTAAIPLLLLMGYKLPKIYATPYTARRLEQELSNSGLDPHEWPPIFVVAPGRPVSEGPVDITPFWVSHSTPQSVGFFIETPAGNILHSGDFKLDPSVIWGPAFDETQFNRIVSKPVDLLLLDSTGAADDGSTGSESEVRETLRDIMSEHRNKRFIVAVMGGYEETLASVAQVTAENDRTLWICGSAHEQSLSALSDIGMTLRDHIGLREMRTLSTGKAARDLVSYQAKESVIVVTGAQGHANAVLTRAAENRSTVLQLNPRTDVVLICGPTMPGQEAQRAKMIATLQVRGIKVLTHPQAALYAHAHARLPEIVDFVKMAKPKNILPIHGAQDQRNICADAMTKMGITTLSADNGDVLKVSSRHGVKSINPSTKGKPPMLGLKTLQGAKWDERYYLVVNAPRAEPKPPATPANGNKKHRPKFFNNNGK